METLIKTDSNHAVELDNIQPPPHYHPETGPQVITSDTARQGPKGRRVLTLPVGAPPVKRRALLLRRPLHVWTLTSSLRPIERNVSAPRRVADAGGAAARHLNLHNSHEIKDTGGGL
jgi:hypothetical protein